MNSGNVLVEKSFSFAIRIVTIYKLVTQEHKEYVLSKQLLRGGTAIGGLIREAQNAESKADFVHKLGIAQKECDETIYWIDLLNATDYLKESDYTLLNEGAKELLRILRSSIITTKQRMNKPINL